MPAVQESGRGVRFAGLPSDETTPKWELACDLPPVVYFIRTKDGLIKVGHTTDLASRRRHFGRGWRRLLALYPGTRQDATAEHRRFREHLVKGREWFHPAPELLDRINELREKMGVASVDMDGQRVG